MDRVEVLSRLREHEPELKAAGVVHLRLFGSVARGDDSAGSDVDLVADFDRSRQLSLMGVGRLQARLSQILEASVDLSCADWMKPPVRVKGLREVVRAF